MEKIIKCGKIDYNGIGRKVNEVELELDFDGQNFSCCGTIWNAKHTDCETAGQCLDTIFRFPEMKPYEAIYKLHAKHHLNDLHAGTEEQEAEIDRWKAAGNRYDYDKACEHLKSKGLYTVMLDGKPYSYGHAWLRREIPEEDKAEIRKWMA